MRRTTWAAAAAVALVAAAATGGMIVLSGAEQAIPSAQEPTASTAMVERGDLSDVVSEFGILALRGRSDGSPYPVINQARGIYTQLPAAGDEVDCGDVLYRVDENPVLLLCGPVPAYRALHRGDVGEDVRQLNENLHTLGFDTALAIDPHDNAFTERTAKALGLLQNARGMKATAALELGAAVFLPESARIATVSGTVGGSAAPDAPVLDATTDTPEVRVNLDPSLRGDVKVGDPARVTLPGNTSVTAKVERLESVVQLPAGQDAGAVVPTIPAFLRLDDPAAARGLDSAPVQVDIVTEGVANALHVPVTALVGKAGGGFAVEVVRSDGRRDLVAVRLGLFDETNGSVEVEGNLTEGDRVVVPSS